MALLCLPAATAMAADSEVANRNLGVNSRQVAKVQAQIETPAVPGKAAATAPATAKSDRPVPTSASDLRIERIDVYGSSIEELEGPIKPPIQKFGERLAADRPLTPAEKAQIFLSAFLGGPPGRDPTPEERTEARVSRGGTMLTTPRGSLQ